MSNDKPSWKHQEEERRKAEQRRLRQEREDQKAQNEQKKKEKWEAHDDHIKNLKESRPKAQTGSSCILLLGLVSALGTLFSLLFIFY